MVEISVQSSLFTATKNGNVTHIRELYDDRVELNMRDSNGFTLVCLAVLYNHIDAIGVLCELGANVNNPNNDGLTPACIAADCNSIEAMQKLIKLGANTNTPVKRSGYTPAYIAVCRRNLSMIKILAKAGASINSPDKKGFTPLHIASQSGHIEMIELLIQLGALIDIKGMYGWTPLILAAQNGHEGAIISLTTFGTDINTEDSFGETALDISARSLHTKTAILLVNIGANISAYMQSIVCEADIHDVFNAFCEQCNAANTPLMYAVFSLTKLLCYILLSPEYNDEIDLTQEAEKEIACSLMKHIKNVTIQQINEIQYVLKRKLAHHACRVYESSLLFDGVRLTFSTKMQRYTELVCFCFNETMLRDVLALRLTCKANHELRRFPVYCCISYHELEQNLIEGFIAHDSSRFVQTSVINGIVLKYYSFV